MIKLIVAVDEGNAIGWQDGKLPWKVKGDLPRFKALTTGHTVLMGANTYKTLPPHGLPNRKNVVVSRSMGRDPFGMSEHGPQVFQGDLAVFVQAHQAILGGTPGDLWVIGGAQVYAQAIEQRLVEEIHLTLVPQDSGANVTLPFDLFDYQSFMRQQAEVGVKWSLTHNESFSDHSYVILKRDHVDIQATRI